MISWRSQTDGGDAEVLLDQEQAHPLEDERLAGADEVLDDGRRQALGRLVHDQELGVEEQRAPDGEHLLLAAGELRAADLLALGQAREELVDLGDRPAPVAGADHAQVLVGRQRLEEPAALRHVADPPVRDLVRGEADELLALERDRAGDVGRRHADDRVAERRLAHAVAADDRQRLRADLEVDVLEDVRLAVVGVDAADLEERLSRRHGAPFRGRGRGRGRSCGSRPACPRR